MSILKESKSLDDRSIKEDTPYEKWADRFPTGKYRTFATHVPMFDFETKTSPTLQWTVDDFSKWFKNPAGLSIAPSEKVPFTHYNLTTNEPAKVDKDVFGNNIINNQKDFKADHMNQTLPEKYAYGLDRKGQGDLAYEQLDIEGGDGNEMSRARDEFLEQLYLKEQGIDTEMIRNDKSKLERDITEGKGSERKIRQLEDNERILVEAVPNIMGKVKDPRITMEEIQDVYIFLKSKRDTPLPQRAINDVNRLLMRLDGKRIPNGTYASAAADKIEEAFKKQNPRAKWSFGSEYKILTDDMAGKIQRNVRRRAAQNTADKLRHTADKVRHKSLLTNVIEEAQQKGNKVKRALFSPDTLQSPKGTKKRISVSQQKIKFPTPSFGLTPSKVLKSRTTTPVSPDNDPSALTPTVEDIQQQAAGGRGKTTANQSNQYMQDLVKKHVPAASTIQSFKGNKGDIPERK